MITLNNHNVTLIISEIGAEMQSLKYNGTEFLWQGYDGIWSKHAPILFPICGGLKDDKFTYKGKEYTLPKHGYAKNEIFSVESKNDTEATFLHTSNEETLKMFPFLYEFRVKYSLTDSGVKVTYNVTNNGDDTMYFSVGSHEAYATPEGIEEYDVIFPEKETLECIMLDGCLLNSHKTLFMKNSTTLPLYDKFFFFDSPVFKDLKSDSAMLRNRKTGRFINVEFPNKPYFLLWHEPGAPFMCLEPWAGAPDTQTRYGDITKKEAIISLDAKQVYEVSHTITVGFEK